MGLYWSNGQSGIEVGWDIKNIHNYANRHKGQAAVINWKPYLKGEENYPRLYVLGEKYVIESENVDEIKKYAEIIFDTLKP